MPLKPYDDIANKLKENPGKFVEVLRPADDGRSVRLILQSLRPALKSRGVKTFQASCLEDSILLLVPEPEVANAI